MPTLKSRHTLLEVFLGQWLGVPVVREAPDIEVLEAIVVGTLWTFANQTDVLCAWNTVDLALFLAGG